MTSPQPGSFSTAPQPPPPPGPLASAPWLRSSTDRVIAGVCGGVGRRLGIDPVILRVVVVVLAFFAGAGIVLYAAAWLLMPLDRTNQSVLSDALGADSEDRVRSVLTAGALLVAVVTAGVFAIDGGFVPGLLIALVVIGVLLVVRRDETATAGYGPPQYAPQQYAPPAYAQPPSAPAPYAPAPAATPQYGQPQYRPPYASTPGSTEPTVVTDPTSEPTVTMPYPTSSFIPQPSSAPFWEPPRGGPPTPTSYQLDEPPPAPPRERSYLGVLTISAMIAVVGAMSIVDLSGVAVPLAGYVVAALGVVAAGLVLGAWIGRSRGLIALGIVLGLATGPAILVDAVAGNDWQDWSSAADVRVAPRTPAELAPLYDYGGGSIRLDLTGLDFDGEDLATAIDMGAGEVIVTVPPDVDVTIDAGVVAGDLTVFDRRSSGFDANESLTDVGADGPGGGELDLLIDLGLGNVEVRRATS